MHTVKEVKAQGAYTCTRTRVQTLARARIRIRIGAYTRTYRQDVLRLDHSDATCSNLKVNVAGRANAFLHIIIVIDIVARFRDGSNKAAILKNAENFLNKLNK